MSLKGSQPSINFQTVKTFTTLLSRNKKNVVKDSALLSALEPLMDVLYQIENATWENKFNKVSAKLSLMTEEERRVSLMGAKEKKFFLSFKEKHPDRKWDYFKEYQKMLQAEYKLKQMKQK